MTSRFKLLRECARANLNRARLKSRASYDSGGQCNALNGVGGDATAVLIPDRCRVSTAAILVPDCCRTNSTVAVPDGRWAHPAVAIPNRRGVPSSTVWIRIQPGLIIRVWVRPWGRLRLRFGFRFGLRLWCGRIELLQERPGSPNDQACFDSKSTESRAGYLKLGVGVLNPPNNRGAKGDYAVARGLDWVEIVVRVIPTRGPLPAGHEHVAKAEWASVPQDIVLAVNAETRQPKTKVHVPGGGVSRGGVSVLM